MKFKQILFILCIFASVPKAQAYITYLNGRIDRSLYDGHDPKLVVAGKIAHVKKYENKNKDDQTIMIWEGPEVLEIDFEIKSVIMGDGKFMGQKLNISVSSFTWPVELVKQDTSVFCILILREYKNDTPRFQIEVVVPAIEREILVSSPPYLRIRDNKSAIQFLESELLLVLKTKLHRFQLRETLLMLGPILQKENCDAIEKFIEYKNDWVIRVALACIVYASENDIYVKQLAKNIETYFSTHNEKTVLNQNDDFKNYAPYYVYYTYVFFLDPGQRAYGTKWDEKEAGINQRLANKIKATNLISKNVCKKLEI